MNKGKTNGRTAGNNEQIPDPPTNGGYGVENPKLDDLARNKEDAAGEFLTTNQGVRVNDNQKSLKAGDRVTTLLEDYFFRATITHFDTELIHVSSLFYRASD